MILPLTMEIGNETLLKNIKELQALFEREELERINLRFEEFYKKVTSITSKIQKAIDDGTFSYIFIISGRGDEFIDDVFSLFQYLESQYGHYIKESYLSEDELSHYKLIERTSLSIQAYIRVRLGLRMSGEFGGIIWEGIKPDGLTQLGIEGVIEKKCSSSVENVHYGDVADEIIEETMIRQIYYLIRDHKLDKAKEKLRLLIHHVLVHQYKTIGALGISQIHGSTKRPMDGKYHIDLVNVEHPIITVTILTSLIEKLSGNLELISQINAITRSR